MTKKEAISILRKWRNIGKKDMTSERLGYIEGWFHKDDSEAFAMAIKALEERKTGRWIEHDDFDNSWECSACNEVVDIIEGTPMDNEYRFCPWCGAEMEGGADNE